MAKIIQNAIRTPDGTMLISAHRHDCRTYFDSSVSREYMIDGGLDYIRRNLNIIPPADNFTIYDNDLFEIIREKFLWGTYGKEGTDPMTWVVLKDMSSEHINNILEIDNISEDRRKFYMEELATRGVVA